MWLFVGFNCTWLPSLLLLIFVVVVVVFFVSVVVDVVAINVVV